MKRTIFWLVGLIILGAIGFWSYQKYFVNSTYNIGEPIDSLNGIKVYYNGNVGNVSGRNTTENGYNLGLKYQCVEFVKRYYFEHLNHQMPDSYGHAKDFFIKNLADGTLNKQRNLMQFNNPSKTLPKENDLLVFDETIWNSYGHVAIVSKVLKDEIEIIQQNPGKYASSREIIELEEQNGQWKILHPKALGWLRKE